MSSGKAVGYVTSSLPPLLRAPAAARTTWHYAPDPPPTFVAAATTYANFGINMIPFYIYYSMFGFQRVGDEFWLAGDIRAKGFLLGATYGRTTLNGEGLQHQDGHSMLHASSIPTLMAYDPAFAYELAVVVQGDL